MANMSKTIKGATDKELDEILIRLRKEREVQGLIADIKRTSTPRDPLNPYDYTPIPVSTEESIESMYHNEAADNVLAHFGIPGMHWGVRRGRASGPAGAVTAKGRKETAEKKEEVSEDYRVSRELKAKGHKRLSTKELKDLTQRMQLEKQLRDLKTHDYTKGMDTVKALTAAGTTMASLYALSKTPLGKQVISGVKSSMSSRAMQTAYKKAMGG